MPIAEVDFGAPGSFVVQGNLSGFPIVIMSIGVSTVVGSGSRADALGDDYIRRFVPIPDQRTTGFERVSLIGFAYQRAPNSG